MARALRELANNLRNFCAIESIQKIYQNFSLARSRALADYQKLPCSHANIFACSSIFFLYMVEKLLHSNVKNLKNFWLARYRALSR